MKEYTVYVCEKCGQEFPDDYEKCKEHEKSHIKPEHYGIMNNGSYQPEDKYPTYITIPMADGAEVMYQFEAVTKEAKTLDDHLRRFGELKEKYAGENAVKQEESPLLPTESLLSELLSF